MNAHFVKRAVSRTDMGNYALFPVYRNDHEELRRLKFHRVYTAKVWEPRNGKYHRLFFALCRLVVDNSGQWASVDQFRKAFMMYGQFVEIIPGIDGHPVAVPDSMAFDKMDEETFDREVMPLFWQACARELGLDVEDLKTNYERYLS